MNIKLLPTHDMLPFNMGGFTVRCFDQYSHSCHLTVHLKPKGAREREAIVNKVMSHTDTFLNKRTALFFMSRVKSGDPWFFRHFNSSWGENGT